MGNTVQSSLVLHDRMTTTLRCITNAMNLTISSMEHMQEATQRTFDTSRIEAARRSIQQAEAALRDIPSPIQESTKQQKRFNDQLQRGARSADGLTTSIRGLLAAYTGAQAIEKLTRATIGGAFEQQKMKDTLIARTGSEPVGNAMFEHFKQDALKKGLDVRDQLTGALSFFSMTKSTKQIDELNSIAQRLAAFDTTGQGLSGAVFSVKEAMTGDIISLGERFNMNKTQIRSTGLVDNAKRGDIEAFIKSFHRLLEVQAMGEKAFERMMQSPVKQTEMLGNNIKSAFAGAGNGALMMLMPVVQQLNEAFQAGEFESFFTSVSQGVSSIVAWLIQLLHIATGVYNFFVSNWVMIEPIIWGIVAAFSAWWTITKLQAAAQGILFIKGAAVLTMLTLQTAATEGLTVAWRTLNAVQKANVFILLISAIAGLIIWIVHLWKTNDNFVVFLMRSWNNLLNFFDQVAIFFARVGIGIISTFFDAKVKSLRLMEGLVNGVIDCINWLIEKINSLGVIEFDTIGHISMAAQAEMQAEAVRHVGAAGLKMMEESVARRAAERESGVVAEMKRRQAAREQGDKLRQMAHLPQTYAGLEAGGFGAPATGQIGDIGRVGSVGNIEDKVDISSEDIKLMREVAEMKSIQNFVTLTPTVQVTTGDILSGSDENTLLAQVKQVMEEEFVNAAQGVYGT